MKYVGVLKCVFCDGIIEAVDLYMKAISIYTDMGRFTIAARHHQTIAEMYETELTDMDKAMKHYEQSADYFKGEESNSSANKCWNKVAHLAALLEQFEKASKHFEDVRIYFLCCSFSLL